MSYIRKIKKNEKIYLCEVECKRVNGKPVQKYIRYIGKEVDGKQILSSSISNIEIDAVKIYGPLIILDSIAKEINLHTILGKCGNEILSLVYAQCIEPRSINQMENWFAKTDLNFILNLENLTEARLLDALDTIEKNDLEQLQLNIFEQIKKVYSFNINSGIIYDVTNTYFYGEKCILGHLGHSKDNKNDKPLVQIGLGVLRDEGIPVFHRVYDGNIYDSRTLPDILSILERFRIKDVVMVYDRGISSKANILSLKQHNLGSICGLPIKGKIKKIIKGLMLKDKFIQIDNRVKLSKTIFYVISQRYKISNVYGKLLVCFNDKMRRDIRESRYDEIVNAQALIKDNKRIKRGLYKYFDKQGNIKKSILTMAEQFDGYSCLFSTENISNSEIVKIYFEKDLIEKAFRSLQGTIQLRPIRHWLYNRVIAHIFICYLAYLLLSLLKYKLKSAKLEISTIEALRELETMYKVYMRDGKKNFKLERVVNFTKKQEQIIKAVNKKLLVV